MLAVEMHSQRDNDGDGQGHDDKGQILLHVVDDVMMQPLSAFCSANLSRGRGVCRALGRRSVDNLTIRQFCMHRTYDCGKKDACLCENTGRNRVSYTCELRETGRGMRAGKGGSLRGEACIRGIRGREGSGKSPGTNSEPRKIP